MSEIPLERYDARSRTPAEEAKYLERMIRRLQAVGAAVYSHPRVHVDSAMPRDIVDETLLYLRAKQAQALAAQTNSIFEEPPANPPAGSHDGDAIIDAALDTPKVPKVNHPIRKGKPT